MKYHEDHSGGSYYGWTGTPNVDVYESTSTGDDAGLEFKVILVPMVVHMMDMLFRVLDL